MPIQKTNWSNTSQSPTQWIVQTSVAANAPYPDGSPIGLLLTLTYNTNEHPLSNWTMLATNSTNWDTDTVFTTLLLSQDGAGILSENGKGLLFP